MRRFVVLLLAGLMGSIGNSSSAADWPMFGGNPTNNRQQAEDNRLEPASAGNLRPLWETTVLGPLFKSPVVDESGVYLSTYSHAYGLNRDTGQIRWEKPIDQLVRECPGNPGEELPPEPIAFLSETSPAIAGDKLIFSVLPDIFTYADINATHRGGGFVLITDKNGQCLKRVLVSDHSFEGVLGSPTVHNGIAYVGVSGYEEQVAAFPGYTCCSTIGKVCAVDIAAGVKKWCSNLVDADPSTPEYDETAVIDGKEVSVKGISGVTVWSSAPAIDEKNNQVIVTTGNAYTISAEIDPTGLPPKSLPVDAFVAIDLNSGVIKSVQRVVPDDFWNVDCLDQTAGNCLFEPVGPDYDFGAGASLLSVNGTDIAVAINKAGTVYAVDTATLSLLWQKKVGPTTLLGLAGSATDGSAVYVSNPDIFDVDFSRLPESPFIPRDWQLQNCPVPDPETGCPTSYGGILSALNPASGDILWQNTDPSNLQPLPPIPVDEFSVLSDYGKSPYLGPPAVTHGLVFQGAVYPNALLLDPEAPSNSEDLLETFFGIYPNANAVECPFPNFLSGSCQAAFPSMFAYDGAGGEILWSFNASGPVIAGAAIADGVVYWGSMNLSSTEDVSTIYAFGLPPKDSGVGGEGPNPLFQGGGCSLQLPR